MKSALLVCMAFMAIKSLRVPSLRTSFLDAYNEQYRRLRFALLHSMMNEQKNPNYQRYLREHGKYQNEINDDVPFPCSLNNTKSKQIPENVNKLRPGDIKIVGAIGDSLTAGYGITSTNFVNALFDNRGLSFLAGGQGTWRQYLTLPNILKVFNPNLIGYSLRASLSIERASQFNVAEGGAVSADTPYMAQVLVKRIKRDPRVNLEKDWKMINIFIGANDFCSELCYTNPPEQVLVSHRQDMIKVLRILKDNLPRTFVNLIPPPNVETLAQAKGIPHKCSTVLRIECPCIIGLVFERFRERFTDIIKKWQELDMEIASYPEFNGPDFQVVGQPLFVNFSVPEKADGSTDLSYLGADCFHFSQKGGALVANVLWNNLLQPVGKKRRTAIKLFTEFNCPTEESPFLFTQNNSI